MAMVVLTVAVLHAQRVIMPKEGTSARLAVVSELEAVTRTGHG
jgi:hypothetical protein